MVRLPLLLAVLMIGPSSVHADLFADDSVLQVTLTAPIKTIRALDEDEDGTFEATLSIDGGEVPLKVSPRGKSRRGLCKMPPLWLDFKKKRTSGTPFAGQNKLKLVTHCSKSGETRGYLASEFLAYRLFNVITDQSFRVRWLDVTYVDSERPDATPLQHGAFVIEHKSQLEDRLGVKRHNVKQTGSSELDDVYAAQTALFAYLLGNTDFSLIRGPEGDNCCHNIVLFKNAEGRVLPVPYDFDATGLVNPPYAAPVASMGIRRVTQRRYRGYCAHNVALGEVRQRFLDQRQALVDAVNTPPLDAKLPERKTKTVLRFIDSFFATLADDKQYERKILSQCR